MYSGADHIKTRLWYFEFSINTYLPYAKDYVGVGQRHTTTKDNRQNSVDIVFHVKPKYTLLKKQEIYLEWKPKLSFLWKYL